MVSVLVEQWQLLLSKIMMKWFTPARKHCSYKVGIINVKDEKQSSLAAEIYDKLMNSGIEPIMMTEMKSWC